MMAFNVNRQSASHQNDYLTINSLHNYGVMHTYGDAPSVKVSRIWHVQ
jgi:hypothetical protein